MTNQLRELEAAGLISRKSYNTIPPKVEYSITEKGSSLLEILDLMCIWGSRHNNEQYEVINDLRTLCGVNCSDVGCNKSNYNEVSTPSYDTAKKEE